MPLAADRAFYPDRVSVFSFALFLTLLLPASQVMFLSSLREVGGYDQADLTDLVPPACYSHFA